MADGLPDDGAYPVIDRPPQKGHQCSRDDPLRKRPRGTPSGSAIALPEVLPPVASMAHETIVTPASPEGGAGFFKEHPRAVKRFVRRTGRGRASGSRVALHIM